MKIGILYIGIGRYVCFWDEFYKSCEEHFLKDTEKQYFVFTDDDSKIIKHENINIYHQDDMGWPCNSLYRFKMFRRIKEALLKNDYLFFFNSNALFVSDITEHDIIPTVEDYSAMCIEYIQENMGFESRKTSAAYVDKNDAKYYFSGAMNGGKAIQFVELIEKCDDITDCDIRNGIMPVWHDESVINKYLADKNVKVLGREMGKPINWKEPKNAKVVLRRKEDSLGRNWMRVYKGRKHTNTWFRKLLKKIGILKND